MGLRLCCAVALVSLAAGAGSAGAATTDACPAPGAASTASSVTYPTGSVLVGSAAARLEASIASTAAQVGYVVEYGPSTDYGLCTAAGAVVPGQPVQATLTGLTPGTSYHFRVVATDDTGSAAGADQAFTTLPAGAIAQGTTIDGLAVGGMSRPAVSSALRRLIAAPARLALGKRRWTAVRTALGAHIDVAAAVSAALAAPPGQALTAPITVDRHRLAAYLGKASRRYGVAAQPVSLRLVGTRAVVVRARTGTAIATTKAVRVVAAYLTAARRTLLHLPARTTRAPRGGGGKAVVIRLRSQTLTAYVNGKPVLRTPVTTGRPALPTPVGSYAIQARYSPYTFISPWPKGSPYWYPPAPVTWAMYFFDNDFLHDDPAEPASAYGAGSEYGPYASHGCVHVPHDAMAFLYTWLPVGAPVIVAND